MKLLKITAMIAIFLALCGQARALAQSSPGTSAVSLICQPLPPTRSAEDARAQADRLQDIALCPAKQYPVQPKYPVADIRCRPLPPAGSAQVAKIYADALQDLRFCPARQYPVRYGAGTDLPPEEWCTPDVPSLRGWNWEGSPPETDPEIAMSDARNAATEKPCPYGHRWHSIDPDPTPPGYDGPLNAYKK